MKNTILIIGFVWPEPQSTAAGSRMLQLIETFKLEHYTIVFASASKHGKNTFNLSALNVECTQILLNDDSFDDFINSLQPKIVVFDRFMTEEQFGWRVAKNCPNALRILDTEDLHFLRKARHEAIKQKQHFSNAFLLSDTAKREIASIYRCDLSLIISYAELKLLTATFNIPPQLLYYLPFLLPPITNKQIATLPSFNKREHFISIGNFLHAPNYDAVIQLKQHIWNAIRSKLPKAQLHIYGAYKSEKITQLHNEKTGFLIKGFAENVHTVMQNAKVCLAPLRFGAGLKGKLTDAMQNGTPCVMTPIAAEGMFTTTANGFVTNNFVDFAHKAVTLYTNDLTWKEKQKQGFTTINSCFNKHYFQKNVLQKITQLQNTLHHHRNTNFIGQMLLHHSLQSTKYMSKWINEKNKKA